MSEVSAPETGGEMLAAVSTRIVGLLGEHDGRGPSRAKSYAMDDCIVCVMRNRPLTGAAALDLNLPPD
jgi:hypothetical protein